jgi:hypothetical protein
MTQQTINNGDTGLQARTKINDNFTELYTYSLRTNVAAQINGLSSKATPVGTDIFMIEDSADSWNKKKVLISTVLPPLTTKGDLFTYDTAFQRLAVGTNGQVLTADSGEATGLKWAALSSSKIEDADGDTYVDTESGSDTDIVEIGSPNTTTGIIAKFISDTGGTPTDALKIDGNGNIFQGSNYHAVYENTNTFLCTDSDYSALLGTAGTNVLIGGKAGNNMTSGDDNVFIGYYAGYTATSCSDSIAIGRLAGYNTQATTRSVNIGTRASYTGYGTGNLVLGYYAGTSNIGNYNLFLGYYAGGRQSAVSNKIILDTVQRADAATELTDSPIVITTNATKSSQTGTHNYAMTVSNGLTGDIFVVNNTSADMFTVDNNGNVDSAAYIKAGSYVEGTTYLKAGSYIEAASYAKHTGQIRALDTYTSGTTALDEDNYYCMLDGTSSTVTLTLPAINAARDGIEYVFYCNSAANTCTVQTLTSGDYIGDGGTTTSFTMSAFETLTYIANNNLNRWLKVKY